MVMQKIVMFIDDLKNRYIRAIANIVCMVFSCGLTVYGVIQLFAHPILQFAVGVFIGVIDIWMQYLLAYGKWLWKQNDRGAFQYFVAYTLYALFFNFFFAIGFFVMEINITDQMFMQSNMSSTVQQKRIQEIDRELDILDQHLKQEAQSGFGTRSQKLIERKDSLTKERKDLENYIKDFNKVHRNDIKVDRNIFNSLEMVFKPLFGWTANILKVVIFGMLVLVMQFGLIKTSWNINPHAKVNKVTLSEDKKELLIVLDGFFEGKNGNGFTDVTPLNGVDVVSKKTGVSKDKCIYWRNYLSKLKVNGGMAFSIKQGVTYANYKKDFIRDYILSH
jgi:hypothetical protein